MNHSLVETDMENKKYVGKYRFRAIAVGIAIVMLDQLSKLWIIAMFTSGQKYVEITSFFDLVMVWNYGISFGMLAGQRQPLLLTLLSLAIIACLCVWLWRNTSKYTAYALGGIMGGALGNIIDRIRFGAVADFLDFHLGMYHWPAFNIADSSICLGVVFLSAGSMFIPQLKP